MLTSGPRIFVSYARSDGKAFARNLSERLHAECFSLWRDLADMEGGRDWWQQIEEAIRAVEYLVLAITEGALRSDVVRKESPQTGVVFTSGYSRDAVPGDRRLEPGRIFVPKPYSKDDLARAINAALK